MRIATRGSGLALWQAKTVADLLRSNDPSIDTEIVVIETTGDRDLASPLHTIGGKGVFVKEVQAAVLRGRADIAVHSAKDLPALTPAGLTIAAIPARGTPNDCLIGKPLADLPEGATVATGSVRRRAQLAGLRPDLRFAELRGNIATRLSKAPGFDAIVMAAVALERLDLDIPADVIDVDVMIPQVGQGALAIECRIDDAPTLARLRMIDDPAAARLVGAERAFLTELGGDCSLPAGAHATVPRDSGTEIELSAFLATEDLTGHERLAMRGGDPVDLGTQVARTLADRLAR